MRLPLIAWSIYLPFHYSILKQSNQWEIEYTGSDSDSRLLPLTDFSGPTSIVEVEYGYMIFTQHEKGVGMSLKISDKIMFRASTTDQQLELYTVSNIIGAFNQPQTNHFAIVLRKER